MTKDLRPRRKYQWLMVAINRVPELLKTLGWVIIVGFVFFHWDYFGNWLSTVTHVELPGVTIDRFVQAQEKVVQYAGTTDATNTGFNLVYARAAIVRAQRVAPAVKGALVLWVDPNPDNNKQPEDILSDLGIQIVRASSTDEAMQQLSRRNFDLIISNVVRANEPGKELKKCPVRYFGWPSDKLQKTWNNNLDAFNAENNSRAQAGFTLLEQVKQTLGDRAPPMILYSASNGGGIVADPCAKIITNRVDLLLQNVVSALEEQRWEKLKISL